MSAGLQGAIESAPVTRLHERRSYDPADFGVPDGREEEWRFTPLRRLRGLHTDSPPEPSATVTTEVDPAPEVKTFSAERSVAHARRYLHPVRPDQRPGLRVVRRGHGGHRAGRGRHVPAHGRHRDRPGRRRVRPPAGAGRAVLPGRGRGRLPRQRHLRGQRRARGGRRRVALGRQRDGLGRRRGSRLAPLRHPGPGRPAPARRGQPGRISGPAGHRGALRRPGRGRRADRAVLRRRGPAPGAPAVRRPRRAALPQPCHLQGRAAGRGRARGLDRRRADPAGGDRDGHVRVQPEPGAVRRHPGGLGAEPGDPHRGDRRGRPRQRQRTARRPPPVLPDGPRHPVRGGPQAGHPRVLRPADRHHRGAGAARADRRGDRGRATRSLPATPGPSKEGPGGWVPPGKKSSSARASTGMPR